ncbi:hypothetical protein WMY93_028890 [Mugilogobius chulae]|uniref:Uncharacterized protein n=1 Tax=Mugilogobius chulae TaxID=88201 RepID=A0AAW0N1H3_9GOBI
MRNLELSCYSSIFLLDASLGVVLGMSHFKEIDSPEELDKVEPLNNGLLKDNPNIHSLLSFVVFSSSVRQFFSLTLPCLCPVQILLFVLESHTHWKHRQGRKPIKVNTTQAPSPSRLCRRVFMDWDGARVIGSENKKKLKRWIEEAIKIRKQPRRPAPWTPSSRDRRATGGVVSLIDGLTTPPGSS